MMPRRHKISLLSLLLVAGLSACQGKTLVVLEDPRTLIEDRSLDAAQEDSRIRLDINSLYIEQGTGQLKNVKAEVYEGAVLLIGTVGNPADRDIAGTLAAAVKGASPVYNEIQVAPGGSLADEAADLTIENKVKQALRAEKEIHSVNLRWHSVNGIVYLFGRALGEAERDRALAVIRKIEGVKDTVDHVKVVPLTN